MTTSEQTNELAAAMAQAQRELKPANKDMVNPAYRSKYADLASIIEVSRVYAAHGIAVLQEATVTEKGASVVTRLLHLSGQWVEMAPLVMPLSKSDAHGAMSGVTYAKRASLAATLNIATDDLDDDGNTAAGLAAAAPVKTSTRRPAAAPPAAASPAAPEGFDAWRLRLLAAAGRGYEHLETEWLSGDRACRVFLATTDPTRMAELKAKAGAVDQAQVPA